MTDLYVAVARGLVVGGDATYSLQVETYAVGGTALVDGATPDGGTLWAHDEVAGDTVRETFAAGEAEWWTELPAGTWTILGTFVADDWGDGSSHSLPVAVCVGVSGT